MIGALSSDKRHSINPKMSVSTGASEAAQHGAAAPPASAIAAAPIHRKISLAGRLSHQLTPPRLDAGKRRHVSSPGGQLFLCIIGTLLSMSVSVWLAFFSTDTKWRRAVFASAAALCSVMFMALALTAFRRNIKLVEKYPDIEASQHMFKHRRSTTCTSTGAAGGGLCRRSTHGPEDHHLLQNGHGNSGASVGVAPSTPTPSCDDRSSSGRPPRDPQHHQPQHAHFDQKLTVTPQYGKRSSSST